MVTRQQDQLVNGCIVGRKLKQWWWMCVACGEGAMVQNRWTAEERSDQHECGEEE
jgi:hypothetical protein